MIGQFHTLFFGSVRMFFLGVLGFAVYGNEALHFSCLPDRRELNVFCYNQFRPITPQVHFNTVCFQHLMHVCVSVCRLQSTSRNIVMNISLTGVLGLTACNSPGARGCVPSLCSM